VTTSGPLSREASFQVPVSSHHGKHGAVLDLKSPKVPFIVSHRGRKSALLECGLGRSRSTEVAAFWRYKPWLF
jgi:hypothetical protein